MKYAVSSNRLPWGKRCDYHPKQEMSYMEWFDSCYKLLTKGVRQKQCPVCGYWFWPEGSEKILDALSDARA